MFKRNKTLTILIFIVIVLFFIGVSLIPKYPTINPEQSKEKIMKQIINNSERLMNEMYFIKSDNGRVAEWNKEVELYDIKLSQCKNSTECLEAYNNFMENNIIDDGRVTIYRERYMIENFGQLGANFNKVFKEHY